MDFLLLEKDFENRDSLDLITDLKIYEFLESKFAENVVLSIWRSPYATHDSIFTAARNHYLTFNWWHCRTDLENERVFYKRTEEEILGDIEAHPL